MTFSDFFTALWSTSQQLRNPFPWQDMLANNVTWPQAIDLPTASGKTACIDAAVYRLAIGTQSSNGADMPRRIWFVVDRRIVVDEAFERASLIADKLQAAASGPLKEIADRLKTLGGTDAPLAVARLRGGVWVNDKGWADDPRQPAIICTTVDQIGSSLLFRAYGHGNLTASVYAGLAGNDSLIILDEAHCSEPFRQTLDAITRFRQQPWSVEPPPVPFAYTLMSATLPDDLREKAFPAPEHREQALDHAELKKRREARKLATLRLVKDDSALHAAARDAALAFTTQNRRRIAIMVNRVVTAREIFKLLDQKERLYDVVLITGRMRPLDRDKLIDHWSPVLASSPDKEPERPLIVVTTQCLEVGADFSFDALITECASLDALRQRFGRLDRLGSLGTTTAIILLRDHHAKEPNDKDADPIYGKAMFHTWTWLMEISETVEGSAPPAKKRSKRGATNPVDEAPAAIEPEHRVNFGIATLGAALATLLETDELVDLEERRLPKMLAPQPDAPILLPGHLDLLSQTGPLPGIEPDIAPYLHGKGRSSAEVRVVFRCDHPDEATFDSLKAYLPTLTLLPPTGPEVLSVPLHRFRQWLLDQKSPDHTGDVEGADEPGDADDKKQDSRRTIPFIRWRGRKKSHVINRIASLHAGDTIVLPARRDIFAALGQLPDQPQDAGFDRLDLAERATLQAKGRVILRISAAVWEPWKDLPAVKALLDRIHDEEAEREDISVAIATLLEDELAKTKQTPAYDAANSPEQQEEIRLPTWLVVLLRRLHRHAFQIERTARGITVICRRRFRSRSAIEVDPFDEDDADERSRARDHQGEVSLSDHTAQVQSLASSFAANRWPAIADVLNRAAFAHDLGKLDPRFQVMLRGGDYLAFDAVPLAKSGDLPLAQRKWREIEATLRLPSGFRHEMLSAQLAQHLNIAHTPLALHLITSHHGHSRPFAPVVDDAKESQQFCGPLLTVNLQLQEVSAQQRSCFASPHDLASGHANRFWQLTRLHGWWGLAYAESLLRLADWQASARPVSTCSAPPPSPILPLPAKERVTLDLPGLDGANPLGILAALGVLRCLTQARPERDVRLHWRELKGGWKAVVSFDADAEDIDPVEFIVTALAEVLKLGFKAKTPGHEAREQYQLDLDILNDRIKETKASIKKRKLKGDAKKQAEQAELQPLKDQQAKLEQAIIDPTDIAKKAFDAKKSELKNAVAELKKRKLNVTEQKGARAKLIAPIEVEMESLRQAWLVLLREAVPFREMALGKRVDVPVAEYRAVAAQVIDIAEWWPVEMLCHFGCDAITDRGTIEPTPLSFINGSGHQFFLETALELTKCVTTDKLLAALFHPWVPEDEKYSMRWLPSEDRRYALMANNPSGGDKTLTVWAANLLGYAGLGLLSSAPGKRALLTTGVISHEREPAFLWPIWEQPLTALAVSSLIAQNNTNALAPIHRRAMRIEVGDGANKKVNFTPSVAC